MNIELRQLITFFSDLILSIVEESFLFFFRAKRINDREEFIASAGCKKFSVEKNKTKKGKLGKILQSLCILWSSTVLIGEEKGMRFNEWIISDEEAEEIYLTL